MRTLLISFVIPLLLFPFGVQAQYRSIPIPAQEENTWRVMTYNIRNAKKADQETNYSQVADVIHRVAPDVVAIQEVDSATSRSHGAFVLKEIAQSTMMYHTYGAIGDFEGGKLGLGVLSKEKPLHWHTISLPGKEEPRGLLVVEFDKYVVCCTQLSLELRLLKFIGSIFIFYI